MIDTLLQQFTNDPLVLKDFALGFFMALALRRGRVKALLDGVLPNDGDK